MKELIFEELTLKQKLGMVFTGFLNSWVKSEDNEEFLFELIKERALGVVWIQQGARDAEEMLAKVKELADYPIIVVADAESGISNKEGTYLVGRHSAIGNTGDPKNAYVFGKVLGAVAHKMGYNMVCNPLLDIKQGHIRSLGSNKEKVAEFGVAMAQGMHDGGLLTLAKHYPGADNPLGIDSHMTAAVSYQTKEELIDEGLYPYIKLMEQGVLDGVMTGHKKCVNIDPDHPASMSKKVIDIIRELGFEGVIMTDALCMMGIKALYNDVEAKGYAIAAGNDTILPFTAESRKEFADLCAAYDQGMIPDEVLDAAVKRILAAQHKTLSLPKDVEITEEEMEIFRNIDKNGVYAKTDEGVSTSLLRDGKYYFAVMIRNEMQFGADGKIDVDTFSSKWHYPLKIEQKIKELFPNAAVNFIHEFPSQGQNIKILNESLGYDDVIFLTFTEPLSFTGKERLTHRLVTLISAMRMTERVNTVIHFGNPRVLEDLPHMPRLIVGNASEKSVEATLEVLAGEYPAKGTLSCEVKLQ